MYINAYLEQLLLSNHLMLDKPSSSLSRIYIVNKTVICDIMQLTV